MRTLILCALFFSAAFCATYQITAVGTTWSPACLDINVGDTVNVTFGSTHNFAQTASATSTTANGGLYSGAVGVPGPYTHTFSTVEVVYYICEAHVNVGMRGSINVRAAGNTTTTCTGSTTNSGSSGVSVVVPSALLVLAMAVFNL